MPELYGGYGHPVFVFYQPAFFFLLLPFSLVFGPVVMAFKPTLQILCAFGIDRLPLRRPLWKPLSFVGLTLFAGGWQWSAFVPRYAEVAEVDVLTQSLWEERLWHRTGIHRYAGRNEYLPRTAVDLRSLKPKGEQALLTLSGPGEVVPQPGRTAHRLHNRVLSEPDA